MAKNVLPVDFQDDILAESMNGRRKYQMITNSDGTVSFVDVTEYTQVGSNFGQAQVNATNEAVNESADKNKIIDDKDDLVANSQAGMIAGALAVKAIREELNQNMNGLEDDISELTSDMSGKQNKISNQSFAFTPNEAGITTSSIRCFRYGNVCIVTGTFTPNQAGTPLTLGGFNVHPTQAITFPITGYEKVASYGTLSASGVFQCNIPGAMANETCAINFAFLTT